MPNTEDPAVGTLNIPSLLAFAVVTFLAVRYFFFSSSQQSSSQPTGPSLAYPASRRRVPQERIDTIVAMFPQLSRRNVEWDLLSNGGSVQATSERVLREGRLPAPPPNFQASASPSAASSGPGTPQAQGSTQQSQQRPQYSDLITRYNLLSRLPSQEEVAQGNSEDDAIQRREKGGWSGNKTERQALLKKRREDMVLAARRKLEERERASKATGSS